MADGRVLNCIKIIAYKGKILKEKKKVKTLF
jgi:hypothetical protein